MTVTITDIDSTLSCTGSLSGYASDQTLIPMTGIVFTGTPPDCELQITPQAGLFGTATITLEVTDGYLSDFDTFTLTVSGNNTPPVITGFTVTADEDVLFEFDLDHFTGDYFDAD